MSNTTPLSNANELDKLLLEARTDEYGDSGNYNAEKLKQLITTYAEQFATSQKAIGEKAARLHELKALKDSEIANTSLKKMQIRIDGRIAQLSTEDVKDEK